AVHVDVDVHILEVVLFSAFRAVAAPFRGRELPELRAVRGGEAVAHGGGVCGQGLECKLADPQIRSAERLGRAGGGNGLFEFLRCLFCWHWKTTRRVPAQLSPPRRW